jgi:hypothetical protein
MEEPMISFVCGCKAKFINEKWEVIFVCQKHTNLVANPIKIWEWVGAKDRVGQCDSRAKNGKCTGSVYDCCIRYCPGKIDGGCRISIDGKSTVGYEELKCKKSPVIQENIEPDVVCTVDEEKDDKQVFVFKKKGNQADWENTYTR